MSGDINANAAGSPGTKVETGDYDPGGAASRAPHRDPLLPLLLRGHLLLRPPRQQETAGEVRLPAEHRFPEPVPQCVG